MSLDLFAYANYAYRLYKTIGYIKQIGNRIIIYLFIVFSIFTYIMYIFGNMTFRTH